MARSRRHLFVCTNVRDPSKGAPCCGGRESKTIYEELKKKVREKFSNREVRVSQSGCLGFCRLGPNIVAYPEGVWYKAVTPDDIEELLESHVVGGKPVERLLLDEELL